MIPKPLPLLRKLFVVSAIIVLVHAIPRACAAQEGAAASPNPGKIVGVWDGTTLASCSAMLPQDRCNAQQRVSITVLEGENGKLGGFYQCSFGTQNCYNLNETGKVADATITGSLVSIRVMMRDGTSCNFNGRPANSRVDGTYVCTSGGAVFERGSWRARRSY